jgi:hypothetical protein
MLLAKKLNVRAVIPMTKTSRKKLMTIVKVAIKPVTRAKMVLPSAVAVT